MGQLPHAAAEPRGGAADRRAAARQSVSVPEPEWRAAQSEQLVAEARQVYAPTERGTPRGADPDRARAAAHLRYLPPAAWCRYLYHSEAARA